MEIIMASIGGAAALFFLFIGWRNFKGNRNALRREKKLLDRLLPLLKKLEVDELPSQELVDDLASDPFTRDRLYFILTENDLGQFFPEKYISHEAAAESALVYWLNHGNELGESPEEIVLTAKISRFIESQNTEGDYYVYKFSEPNPPENAPEWMVGIAGPYIPSEPPYTYAPGTFSSFEDYHSQTPEEHVDWLHEMMVAKGAY